MERDYHGKMPDGSDSETIASFRVQGLTRYCFGNRWEFAVECEVQDCDRDPLGVAGAIRLFLVVGWGAGNR